MKTVKVFIVCIDSLKWFIHPQDDRNFAQIHFWTMTDYDQRWPTQERVRKGSYVCDICMIFLCTCFK